MAGHDPPNRRRHRGPAFDGGRGGDRPGRPEVRHGAIVVERHLRPAPGGHRVLRLIGGRGRGDRVRQDQRVGDLGARRRPLLQRSLGRGRRVDDSPGGDEQGRGGSGPPAGPGRRWRDLGRGGRGHPGARPGRDRRPGQRHRRRWAHPGRRDGLAVQSARAHDRQPRVGRGRARRWPHRAGLRVRASGPVLGGARRRRQLRCDHRVRVPAAPNRAGGAPGPAVLGDRARRGRAAGLPRRHVHPARRLRRGHRRCALRARGTVRSPRAPGQDRPRPARRRLRLRRGARPGARPGA